MIYVLIGHSGSGKTTLAMNLESKGIVDWVYTSTTRPPRVNGEIGYDFISLSELKRGEAKGDIVGVREFRTYIPNADDTVYYGIKLELLDKYADSDNDCVIISDLGGLNSLFEIYGPEWVRAVYLSGSKELLKARAASRVGYVEREWERRFEADDKTLSQKELDRHAFGDKFITGYKFYSIPIDFSPDMQIYYFKEVILGDLD